MYPSKNRRKLNAYEKAELARIATATRFTAHLRCSPSEKYTLEAATLVEAREQAQQLETQYSRFGRGACVYAISKEGFTILVPESYQPAAS